MSNYRNKVVIGSAIAVLIIIIIIIALAVGLGVINAPTKQSNSGSGTRTNESPSATSTGRGAFSSSSTASVDTSASRSCDSPAQGAALYARVIAQGSEGSPLANTTVVGASVCDSGEPSSSQAFLTNGSGYISIQSPIGDYYLFSLRFDQQTYQFNGTVVPMRTTYVTIRLPDGSLNETVCNNTTAQRVCSAIPDEPVITSETGVSNSISLNSVSLRANASDQYSPTLAASLSVESSPSSLVISVNGTALNFEPSIQGKNGTTPSFNETIGIEIKDPRVAISVGAPYLIGIRAAFSHDLEVVSKVVVAQPPSPSNITLREVSIRTHNVTSTSQLSASVLVRASVPLSTIQVIVNGTDQGTSATFADNNLTDYVLTYAGGLSSEPLVSGDTYVVQFVATFDDGSTSTATATIVAD